jgi:hypothetical protein
MIATTLILAAAGYSLLYLLLGGGLGGALLIFVIAKMLGHWDQWIDDSWRKKKSPFVATHATTRNAPAVTANIKSVVRWHLLYNPQFSKWFSCMPKWWPRSWR